MQTLESISREQDVISSLETYISHALPSHLEDGQNIPKQSDMKKSNVETYDKKQVFDLFLKGANIMVFFAYSRKCTYVG